MGPSQVIQDRQRTTDNRPDPTVDRFSVACLCVARRQVGFPFENANGWLSVVGFPFEIAA
jgi:hypothetical protein